MQQFDITVQTVGAFVVHAAGRYIKYVSGNNGGGDTSLIVTPGAKGGSKIVLYPGQSYRVADDAAKPDSWTLANATGSAVIIGKVVVGDGRIDDNTLTGNVNVVDGGKFRTLGNTAFAGYATVGAVAGQYGRVQLWSPATNTNRLVVENVTVLANGGLLAAVVQFNAVALANFAQNGVSKKSSGVASTAAMNYDTTAAVLAIPGTLIGMAEPNPGTQGFKFAEPIIVMPGYGLVMYSSTLNTGFGASYEWYEEPNV